MRKKGQKTIKWSCSINPSQHAGTGICNVQTCSQNKRKLDTFKNLQGKREIRSAAQREAKQLKLDTLARIRKEMQSATKEPKDFTHDNMILAISIFRCSSNAKPHSFITQISQWSNYSNYEHLEKYLKNIIHNFWEGNTYN